MTRFFATVEVAAPVTAVWERMVDWPAHTRWIPLTRVWLLTASGEGVGARFVGRTGVGPFAFDDPMEIVEWLPPSHHRPGRCAVRKLGSVVTGSAAFDVVPVAPRRTRVVWDEDIDIWPRPLTRLASPVVRVVGRAAFGSVLRTMVREVEAEHRDASRA